MTHCRNEAEVKFQMDNVVVNVYLKCYLSFKLKLVFAVGHNISRTDYCGGSGGVLLKAVPYFCPFIHMRIYSLIFT